MNAVDWEELRVGWNEAFGTEFESVKELVLETYKSPGTMEATKRLGVSERTFRDKVRSLGGVVSPVGGRREANGRKRRELLFSLPTREMTREEIAKVLECSGRQAGWLAKRWGLEFKRLKRRKGK